MRSSRGPPSILPSPDRSKAELVLRRAQHSKGLSTRKLVEDGVVRVVDVQTIDLEAVPAVMKYVPDSSRRWGGAWCQSPVMCPIVPRNAPRRNPFGVRCSPKDEHRFESLAYEEQPPAPSILLLADRSKAELVLRRAQHSKDYSDSMIRKPLLAQLYR